MGVPVGEVPEKEGGRMKNKEREGADLRERSGGKVRHTDKGGLDAKR